MGPSSARRTKQAHALSLLSTQSTCTGAGTRPRCATSFCISSSWSSSRSLPSSVRARALLAPPCCFAPPAAPAHTAPAFPRLLFPRRPSRADPADSHGHPHARLLQPGQHQHLRGCLRVDHGHVRAPGLPHRGPGGRQQRPVRSDGISRDARPAVRQRALPRALRPPHPAGEAWVGPTMAHSTSRLASLLQSLVLDPAVSCASGAEHGMAGTCAMHSCSTPPQLSRRRCGRTRSPARSSGS